MPNDDIPPPEPTIDKEKLLKHLQEKWGANAACPMCGLSVKGPSRWIRHDGR